MKKKVLFALIALVSCLTTWAANVTDETALQGIFLNGGVAKLTSSITLSQELNVAEGKTVTLDLNGNTLTYAGPYIKTGVIGVPRGATLIVDDTSDGKGGVINGNYGNKAMVGIAVTKAGDDATKVASLTVNAGTIIGKSYGISGNGKRNGSEITINGGTIKNADTTEGSGIYHPQAGTLIINGGYIEGYDAAVEVRSGNVTVSVNGGQFVATNPTYSCGPNGNGTTTKGAAFAVAQHTTSQPISVSIAGGTFTGPVALSVMNPQNGTANNVTVGVTGGTFNGDVVITDARVNPSAILTGGATFNPSFTVSEPDAQTFTGSALTPVLTVTKDNVTTDDYEMRYFNANGQEVAQIINAGNYTVVVGLSDPTADNLAYLTTVPFTVDPMDISNSASVTPGDPFYYNGQVQQPFVYTADPEAYTTATGWVVKDGPAAQATSNAMTYGTDFTVTYQANSSYTTAGQWSFTVVGTGNYTGSRQLNYNIQKGYMSAANFSLNPATLTYNGVQQIPTVTCGYDYAVAGTDYVVALNEDEGFDGKTAQTQQLIITAPAGSNFTTLASIDPYTEGPIVKEYTINPATNDALQVAWSVEAGPDLTYNGIEQKPEDPEAAATEDDPIVVTAQIGEDPENVVRLVKGQDYTIAYSDADYTKAGQKNVYITGINNYANGTGTSQPAVKTLTYTIKARPINSTGITVSTVPATFTFNDQEQKPTSLVVEDNGLALPTADLPYTLTGDDYNVSYTEDGDYTSAGDKQFTLTGKGNYTGESNKTYKINGYLVTINGAMVEKTYGEVDPAPDFNVDAASDYKPSKEDIAPYLQFAREENGEDVKIVKVGNTDAWTIGTYDYRVEANPENPQNDYNFQFLQQGSKLKINQRPLTITVLPQSKVFGTADAIDQTKISVEGLAYNQTIGIDDREAVVTVNITRVPFSQEENAELEEAKGTYEGVLKAELVSVVLGDKDITNNYKVGEIIPGDFTIDPEPVGDVTIVGYKQTGTEDVPVLDPESGEPVMNPDSGEPETQEVPVYEVVYTVDGENEVVYAGRCTQPVDKWTVTKGETELVPDVDYTVTVVNSENSPEFEWNVDTYTYTFNFQGNYSNNKDPETGEVIPTTAVLDIVPAPLTITYNGQEVTFGNPLTAANAWDDFTFGVTTQVVTGQDPETGDDIVENITENTFVDNEEPTFALAGTPVIVSEYEYEGEDAWGAGSYQKVLDIEGIEAVNGNYDITLVRGDLTVTKAVLEGVYIKQDDIVYNGSNPFTPSLVDYEGNPIAGITYTQDIFTYWIDNADPEEDVEVENPRNVGTYTIRVTDADLTGIVSDNFEIAGVVEKVAKITQKAATITAENKEMAFGAAVPELTATYDGFLLGEEAGLTVAFTIDNAPVAESYDYGTHVIRVTATNLDPENDVKQNYNITYVEGTLTVGTASDALVFAISAEPQTYNGLAFDFAAYKAVEGNLDIEYVSGMLAADEADETKKAAIIEAVKAAVEYALAPGDAIEEEGTYAGRITATAAPENFNYNVTFTPADLVIEPYEITIEILDQTIAYGQQPKLNAVLGQTVNYVTPNKLASGDKLADLNITLSVDAENNIKATYDNHNYDITFIDGELTINYDEQIALVRPLLNTTALWNAPVQQGHELIFTNAEMTAVAPEGDIVDNTAAQLIADYDGKKVNVTFGHFAMQPDQWYPLVLPFDMNVKTISKNFGYAVIDVVDPEKSSAEHISFKIDIHDIPANTPFLIKVPEPIDMADVTFLAEEDPKFRSIDQIVNPADKAALSVDITDGNKFVGTYTGYNRFLEGTDVQRGYLASDGKLYPNSSKFYVFPLGAYFEYGEGVNSANVRISIEEPDGTTTTISAVEADAEGAEYAEGWYTVTGVKLTAEPTVSGTYIYNGQKVYIKK